MVPFSVLDLAPIVEGGDASLALRRSLELARHAEELGYRRFWLAEHHNMPGIASAATTVVMAHVAGGTRTIRVGAGGIMLPNHAPLIIAEQFGTLEALFPGRIDLGLGRAPGTDPLTARALRRNLPGGADTFAEDVQELISYLGPPDPEAVVHAVPGTGSRVPVWILGSSLFGAQLAAALGLPYAFASHFAPAQLMRAIDLYRSRFRPSEHLDKPHLMVAANVVTADTDEEARYLWTSLQQAFVNLRRGRPAPLPRPVEGFDRQLTPQERAMLADALACSFVGSPDTVRKGLHTFLTGTGADELIIAAQIHDPVARLRSYEITASLREPPAPHDSPLSTGPATR